MPFQAFTNVNVTSICSVPAQRMPVTGLKQLTATLLRLWAKSQPHVPEPSWRWALKAGRPPAANTEQVTAQVYITGGRAVATPRLRLPL
jgi:hypothetical protein